MIITFGKTVGVAVVVAVAALADVIASVTYNII
jgi:hypothetical protein